MRLRENLGKKIFAVVLGLVFAISGLFSSTPVALAVDPTEITPETPESITTEQPTEESSEENPTSTEQNSESSSESDDSDLCFNQVGAISWLVCPTSGFVASIVDTLYGAIEDFLIIEPLTSDSSSPIRIIWEYARNISNIVFIIFFMVVIYSQITGIGFSNYNIKRTLPRIIITAILINLSFFICSLAIDVSNIVGASIRSIYDSVANTVIANGSISPAANFSVSQLFAAIASGAVIAGLAVAVTPIGGQLIFMLIPVLVGVLVAVVVGLFTISLRQAVVALLAMISPLAFVSYILPNTEKWFKKWSDIFKQMIIFYPMFALLFWSSRLAGWALITSATSWLGVILGVAVQIAPLLFSVSLMKMSGTILGRVSNALGQVGNRATSRTRRWSDSVRENRRQRFYAQSNMPYARLQRYMDYRAQLREIDTENARTLRASRAMERAQRRIAKGYNPSTYDQPLKSNRYARTAKRAANASLAATTAKLDTGHVIEQYGNHYKKHKFDDKLSDASAKGWIDYNRAEFTRISDEEESFDYLVGQYLGFMKGGVDSPDYQRYITSAAGKRGATGVMGQLIAKANAVEQRKRRDDAILLAKYGYDKRSQRNMMVGYYVDDNGYAINKDGTDIVDKETGAKLEKYPGYLLAHDPSKLVLWDTVDEKGRPYYNWHDKDGNFLMRIYKDDSAFTKEVLANWDVPIGDPINDLYAILAGHKDPGEVKGINDKINATFKDKTTGEPLYLLGPDGKPLQFQNDSGDAENIFNSIGLSKYSTTLGRAIISSGYKSAASYAGPMAAQAISMSHIKNYVQLNVERLDNIIKSVKPGNFNTQNPAEIYRLAEIMDPRLWDEIFADDLLIGRVNINGEPIGGINEEGKRVSAEEATKDDRKRLLREKYLFPAASKMSAMMSRITQQVLDNQKPGAADAFKKLHESLEEWQTRAKKAGMPTAPGDKIKKGTEPVPDIRSPYIQDSSFANISQDISDSLVMPNEENSALISARNNKRQRSAKNKNQPLTKNRGFDVIDDIVLAETDNPNILVNIDNLYNSYDYGKDSDVNGFLQAVVDLLEESTDYRLQKAAHEINIWSPGMVSGNYDIDSAYDEARRIVIDNLGI